MTSPRFWNPLLGKALGLDGLLNRSLRVAGGPCRFEDQPALNESLGAGDRPRRLLHVDLRLLVANGPARKGGCQRGCPEQDKQLDAIDVFMEHSKCPILRGLVQIHATISTHPRQGARKIQRCLSLAGSNFVSVAKLAPTADSASDSPAIDAVFGMICQVPSAS